MISRLSKGVLPPNTQIQKDALSALSKSATVFVNYIASKYVCFRFFFCAIVLYTIMIVISVVSDFSTR